MIMYHIYVYVNKKYIEKPFGISGYRFLEVLIDSTVLLQILIYLRQVHFYPHVTVK